jgi:D-beta-D-heptose 7-phosphate kinase/D-beta-D-heptose 1-phosphate adenosyltransferase
MIPARLTQIVDEFADKRILVIGDLMLDEFIWGKVSRISPEAPVPVVDVTGESYYPGGAANVARNLREFSPAVAVMGVAGKDAPGDRLLSLLGDSGIDTVSVERDAACRTIVKSRIIARHQQVVRVDREQRVCLSEVQVERAMRRIDETIEALDGIILADYGKGFLVERLVEHACGAARERNKVLTVDPNPRNCLEWHGITAVKPNRAEAFSAAGMLPSDPGEPVEEDRALLDAGKILLRKWRAGSILITLGDQGMLLFHGDDPPYHTPTRAKEVFDVSGAGDTAIAIFTLGLCAGATPAEAAELANHASGVVVGKLGTAILTPAELKASLG